MKKLMTIAALASILAGAALAGDDTLSGAASIELYNERCSTTPIRIPAMLKAVLDAYKTNHSGEWQAARQWWIDQATKTAKSAGVPIDVAWAGWCKGMEPNAKNLNDKFANY